jgi:hypothetical protein
VSCLVVEEGKAGLVVISVLLVVGRRRSVDIVVDGLGSWYADATGVVAVDTGKLGA